MGPDTISETLIDVSRRLTFKVYYGITSPGLLLLDLWYLLAVKVEIYCFVIGNMSGKIVKQLKIGFNWLERVGARELSSQPVMDARPATCIAHSSCLF